MRRIAMLAVVGGLVAALSGCALTDRFMPGRQTAGAPQPGQIEPVHAVVIAQNQAVFWASSNGCTVKADLTPVVRETNEGPIITLRRIKEDRCLETRPDGVELRWSFEELGLTPGARVSVENPYQLPAT